nr:MAG TPA: hypothetical protein [Caudoviricetes sp.]
MKSFIIVTNKEKKVVSYGKFIYNFEKIKRI